MRAFILLACLTVALSYEDRFFRVKHNGGYKQLKHPDRRCKRIGQYIPDRHDTCRYLRCDYGDEPWQDEEGDISFFTQELWCPPGLSTDYYTLKNPWYTGNPCTEQNLACTGGRYVHPKPHYRRSSSSDDDSNYFDFKSVSEEAEEAEENGEDAAAYTEDNAESSESVSSQRGHPGRRRGFRRHGAFDRSSSDSRSYSRYGRHYGKKHNLKHYKHFHKYQFGTDAGFVRAHKIAIVEPVTRAPVAIPTHAPLPEIVEPVTYAPVAAPTHAPFPEVYAPTHAPVSAPEEPVLPEESTDSDAGDASAGGDASAAVDPPVVAPSYPV